MSTDDKPAKRPRARRGRGEGGIGQLPSGRWFAEVSMGFDGAGKRIRRRVYGKTKKDVQDSLRKLQQDAARGTPPAAGAMTVGQLLTDWLAAMKSTWTAGTHYGHDQHARTISGRRWAGPSWPSCPRSRSRRRWPIWNEPG